jgi:hypothetical protein
LIGDDLLEALIPVVEALERLGVAYHVGGSLASSAYGVARSTLDVDVVADLRPEHAAALAASLNDAYYVDEEAVRAAIAARASFNAIHLATTIKIDVFVADRAPFDRAELSRARRETLEDDEHARRFFVKSPEDVVLRKLRWYRDGGEVSERQWSDVVGVLKVQATALDLAYTSAWASQLGLSDLLARALREAGLAG